jgi:hypothetical protein
MRRSWMRRRWMARVAATLFALTLSACNEWGPHETVASPSNDPALTASIRPPLLQTIGDPNLVEDRPRFACSQGQRFTGPLDILMTAGHDVDLHQVAIRLVDGPLTLDVNRFSHEDLTEGFGTTEIPSGTIRTLRFHTRLLCGLRRPQSVAADIQFREASGRKNSITVSVPFESLVVIEATDRRF